ncbi:MAG TPA: hypothetical protein VII82_01835 [Polyangiaceae bacterium]|jgi:hypothetical protein
MGVLEAAARIIQLGGAAHPGRVSRATAMRAAFEVMTGAFSPEDPWFEERSRAFWCDAVTRGRFGREVEGELDPDDRRWLGPLERAHRGLFRRASREPAARSRTSEERLVDVWSGAELLVTTLEDSARAELEAASGQLFDARVVGADDPCEVALLPGAVFHPHDATSAIEQVIALARTRDLTTHETLDALLRMERSLRALSRVKAAYAYRGEALASPTPTAPSRASRRHPKDPT